MKCSEIVLETKSFAKGVREGTESDTLMRSYLVLKKVLASSYSLNSFTN